MAPEVVFRKRASADLANLFDYLNALNPSAAQSYVADVRSACLALSDFPEKARRYDDRYRMLVVRNHIVFYRYEAGRQRIVVARIIDGRRNMEAILRTARSP
jgi:plasmid stabilization system protein ParE